jgi:TRAP-type C4-dicarboxylate transport system substrate-binding protein
MKRFRMVPFTLVAVMVGILFSTTAFAVTKLNYSIFFPAPHKNSVLAAEWAKEVEKRTKGEVVVTMFYGGTLTPADKCYDGVVKSISDIGSSVLSYTMGRFPLSEVLDLPLGSKTGATATRMVNDYYNKFKPKEFDDVQIMYLHAHGPGIIHNKSKAVAKLEDLKGMKIRATGTTGKLVNHFGATAVGMPMGETYDAISRGVAEGVACPAEALQGWKLGEVVKYTTQNFGTAYNLAFFVAMNKAKWNSLSPEIRKIIEQVNEEWIVKTGQAWDEIDKAGYDFYQKQGGKITTLSKAEEARWTKAVQPIFDEYVKEKTAKGLPAQEALKFCQDRLLQLQK